MPPGNRLDMRMMLYAKRALSRCEAGLTAEPATCEACLTDESRGQAVLRKER